GLEIYRSLSASIHFKVFGGSSVEDHGMFVYENYISNIPRFDEEDFIEKLNQIIETYKIDFIFPAHDSVVLKLAQEQATGKLKAHVVTSPLKTCEIARSKHQTYNALKEAVALPKIFLSREEVQET